MFVKEQEGSEQKDKKVNQLQEELGLYKEFCVFFLLFFIGYYFISYSIFFLFINLLLYFRENTSLHSQLDHISSVLDSYPIPPLKSDSLNSGRVEGGSNLKPCISSSSTPSLSSRGSSAYTPSKSSKRIMFDLPSSTVNVLPPSSSVNVDDEKVVNLPIPVYDILMGRFSLYPPFFYFIFILFFFFYLFVCVILFITKSFFFFFLFFLFFFFLLFLLILFLLQVKLHVRYNFFSGRLSYESSHNQHIHSGKT
jgi:hypothetical protein